MTATQIDVKDYGYFADNQWRRAEDSQSFEVHEPYSGKHFAACLPPAFTSVTTKCCWTIRSDMLSVQLPQPSMPELMCGWGCHMGFPEASED
jgi:hypothetical protein